MKKEKKIKLTKPIKMCCTHNIYYEIAYSIEYPVHMYKIFGHFISFSNKNEETLNSKPYSVISTREKILRLRCFRPTARYKRMTIKRSCCRHTNTCCMPA